MDRASTSWKKKKKKSDFQENLSDGVSLPSIFVHGRSLNTQRFKHRR